MEKDRDFLDVNSVWTWLWPVGACASTLVSLVLFAQGDDPVWARGAWVVVAVGTAFAMAVNVGGEKDTLKPQRDLHRGTASYVVLWNTWMLFGSSWKHWALFDGKTAEVVSVLCALLGLVCLRYMNKMFRLSHLKTDSNQQTSAYYAWLVFGICAAAFVLPIHTAQELSVQELVTRWGLFSPLYFVELIVSILFEPHTVEWRFQMCATAWVLTVTSSAVVLSVVAFLTEGVWVYRYVHRERNTVRVPHKPQPQPTWSVLPVSHPHPQAQAPPPAYNLYRAPEEELEVEMGQVYTRAVTAHVQRQQLQQQLQQSTIAPLPVGMGARQGQQVQQPPPPPHQPQLKIATRMMSEV